MYLSFSATMSKVWIKPYGDFVLTGQDFPPTENNAMRRLVFSPDNVHSVTVMALEDGTLLLTNDSQLQFEITLSRNGKVMAVVKLRPDLSEAMINTNWRLTQNGVKNREIHGNPDLIFSKNLNIDLRSVDGIGQMGIKVDNSGLACCVFSTKELLFVRMNGSQVVPQLTGFIEAETERTQPTLNDLIEANPAIRKQIGKEFFEKWVVRHEWGLK